MRGRVLGALAVVFALAGPAGAEGTRSPAAAGTDPWLAFGLNGVNDWSTQLPFLNLMRSARPWIGNTAETWGAWSHDDLAAGGYLDGNGWVRRLPEGASGIATLVLTDLPEDTGAVAGRYRVTHDGQGRLAVSGRVSNVIRGRGRAAGTITFDVTPGPGGVLLTIERTNPDDPLRNIEIVKERHLAAHERGEVFNPDWLARIDGARALRFMDWAETNDSRIAQWQDRPRMDDYTWARIGVPLEVMIALANQTGADPWFTLPHKADDDFLRRYAEMVRDRLDPDLTAYVELSNEVWNWQFAQAHWAEAQGRARWGGENRWMEYYAKRAAEMVMIWDAVFAEAPHRLVRVLSTQAGWPGLEEHLLAPQWQAEDPTNPAPPDLFDAYAITGYFSGNLGAESKLAAVHGWLADSLARAEDGAAALHADTDTDTDASAAADARAAHVAAHRFDHAVALAAQEARDGSVTGEARNSLHHQLTEIIPHHAQVARRWGLALIMYEGGTHVVGSGARTQDAALTEFFTHFNYTEEMGALYRELLEGWYALGGDLFNAFVDVAPPSRWGSWGALRHLEDHNPRWEALVTFDPDTVAP